MRGRAASKCLRGKEKSGADERNRTADLLITNQLLYQLSYVGPWGAREAARGRAAVSLAIDRAPPGARPARSYRPGQGGATSARRDAGPVSSPGGALTPFFHGCLSR